MDRKRVPVVPLIALLVFQLALFGCRSGGVDGDETKAKPRRAQETYRFRDKGGQLVVEKSATASAGLPRDVPRFKPSVVKSAVSSKGANEPSMRMSILQTKVSVQKVARFYQESLSAGGWAVNSRTEDGRRINYSAVKNDRLISVSISPDQGSVGTIISINETTKRP